MRRALPLASAVLALVMTTGSVIAADEAAEDDSRKGPFVVTDRTLGSLLDDGFSVEGILGGSMILVKDAELYSCALVPGAEMLTYKTQFECSVLDEIPVTE